MAPVIWKLVPGHTRYVVEINGFGGYPDGRKSVTVDPLWSPGGCGACRFEIPDVERIFGSNVFGLQAGEAVLPNEVHRIEYREYPDGVEPWALEEIQEWKANATGWAGSAWAVVTAQ